jgi:hypothetical protein
MLRTELRWCFDHLDAIGAEEVLFFTGHLVRDRADHSIPSDGSDHRQAHPGISRCRLDNGAAGAQGSGSLGLVDHLRGDALLDRASRIHELELGHEIPRRMKATQTYDRGIAYGGNDVFSDVHDPEAKTCRRRCGKSPLSPR